MKKARAPLQQYARNHEHRRLTELFAADRQRVKTFSTQVGPLYFDFSKQPIDAEALTLFGELAQAAQVELHRRELFEGEIVNASEFRPALHTALRAARPPEQSALGDAVATRIDAERKACYAFAEKVRSGRVKSASGKPYKYLIHIGIGGSYLGPKFLLHALKPAVDRSLEVHLIANIDGHALAPVLRQCKPEETLVIVVSKTFTTKETLANTRTVLKWLRRHGVTNPMQQLVGITAHPDNAVEIGVPEDQIFTFAEWVGGRFSVWSSVSLVAMIALTPKCFDRFLAGARQMDEHFCQAALPANAPLLAGLLDFYFSTVLGAETRAVFPYDSRLHDLVSYLQQLEMESNGKRADAKGKPVTGASCPVVWGGVGTDAQHAVFQLLHQGTHDVPVEFLAIRKPDHNLKEHHRTLLANCFAQSAALMAGNGADFPGNKPSTTILLDKLTPESLGALLAFYEHRTFVASLLWNLNAFDQPGVQLGKTIAKQIDRLLNGQPSDLQLDASTRHLLSLILESNE